MRPAVWAGGIAALAIIAIAPLYANYSHIRTRVATICKTDAPTTSSGGHQYRVYTNVGTFRISDTVVDGARFNSADLYGRLQPGKTYQLTYYGWRSGFLSSFPNIKSAKLLPPDQQRPNACYQ